MKNTIRRAALLFMAVATAALSRAESAISKYNVVWDSPSTDYHGSMPIGNGDLAANVWVEPDGDLVFYLSKSDAWSGGDRPNGPGLLKLGRVRVRLDPPLAANDAVFRQELDLAAGSIRIQSAVGPKRSAVMFPKGNSAEGAVHRQSEICFWIDALRPVVNVELNSSEPCTAEIVLESWRAEGESLLYGAAQDVIVPTDGKSIRWYQRNAHSVYSESLKVQHLEHLVGKYPDPLLHRTFGGLVSGAGLKAKDNRTLVTEKPAKCIHLRIHARTEQTETPGQWIAHLEQQQQAADAVPLKQARQAHAKWWADFWDRSYVHLSGTPEAETVARAYQLQRWVQACAGRGAYPIKFNGSLFTVDGVDQHWVDPGGKYLGPDYRRWDGPYWFQNTRLIYWPMLYSGDCDQMMPLFRMYRDMLPLLRERTRHYFKHDGVFFSETTQIWGLNRNQDFGLNNPDVYPVSGYIKYYWDSGLELGAMMLDYYAYTQDDDFVRKTLIPVVDEVVTFYDQHYERNAAGAVHLSPAASLETWHTAEDPLPVIAGLKTVLSGLLNLPEALAAPEQRRRWKRFRSELPEIPLGGEGEAKWIKPARTYSNCRNSENPELYAVFPYRMYTVGKPDLEVALETWRRRHVKRTGGWSQDAIQAAMLGLTEEAMAYAVQNATVKSLIKGPANQSRFPVFWGPNFDWIPDQCQGSVTMIALQRMLMLADGNAIRLLPAWPKEWKGSFKLHAPCKTVVEGRIGNGKVVDLKVTPESRRKDVSVIKPDRGEW